MKNDRLTIGKRQFNSRLLLGTDKFNSPAEAARAIVSSGAEVLTFPVRRTNIGQIPDQPNFLDIAPLDSYTLLPTTAGSHDVKKAIRTCKLARELLKGHNLVRLEILADEALPYPDGAQTLEATKILVADGFDVIAYIGADPALAKQLEDAGCSALMPLAACPGSGVGIHNKSNLSAIINNAAIPIIISAGIGTASDAATAMELGCDAVMVNAGIAKANDPTLMASAMKTAVESGRLAYQAGRMSRRR